MSGFDTKWEKHSESIEEQNIVMIVYFRPDKLPEDKAEWYERLGNYAHTTSQLTKANILDNKRTEDFSL